ncbi:MAG TPA: SPFH domain-containing protein [Ktedonobacterales bacterium]|nr:SPFH domain-containing protein [Ktedonobacterales bacterium]
MNQRRNQPVTAYRGPATDPDFLRQRQRQLAMARASLAILRPFGTCPPHLLLAASVGGPPDGGARRAALPRGPAARRLHLPRTSWLTGLQERRRAPVASQPASWLRAARRWSPAVMPPLLSLLLLLAGILLSTQRGASAPLVAPHSVLPLLVLYLAFGTLYGLALYLAPTMTSWLAALTGGVLVYIFTALWILAGPPAVVAVAILVALAAYLYVRGHTHAVPAGQAHVTSMAGGYNRTLHPGTKLLLPGEHVFATVDTTDRQFTCPTQRALISDTEGEPYVARAAAVVAYHIVPSLAHLAALTSENWERELHELMCGTLEEALGEWGRLMLDEQAEVPERFLASAMLQRLRPQARAHGVHVLWLSVRDMWLTPESEIIPVADWHDEPAEPVPALAAEPGYAGVASYPAQRQQQGMQALPPIAEARGARPPSLPLSPEALTPDALGDAYQAVRDGHIHDPETIRDIARAFLAVAANDELNADFPYDAVAAAQILMDKAAALEQAHGGSGPYARS